MSISSDGQLWYGIDFGEPLSEKLGDLRDKGELNPEIEQFYRGKTDEDKENYSLDECDLGEYLNKNYRCGLGMYCSYGYPMYMLIIPESETSVCRGDAEEIKSLDVGPDWDERLQKAIDFLGLEWQDPKWWLTSLYG